MKVLVAVVAILVLVLAVLLVRRLLTGGPEQWELAERTEGEVVRVIAKRGGEELTVGAVPFGDEDFEYRIEELRSEGRQRLTALRGP